MQAQAWLTYDGSMIPVDSSSSVFYRASVASSADPGSHFIGEIINDAEIAGNKYLLYVQPDDWSAASASTQARTQYRSNFAAAYKDSSSTCVMRARGYKIDSLPKAAIFNFEYQNGKSNKRENIWMFAADSTIALQYSNVKAKVPYDLYRWHIYRTTVKFDSVKVYIDENPVPVIKGKTAQTTANNYWRFGDGGKVVASAGNVVNGITEKVAGSVDWILIDTTGAYAPGAGAAIPAEFSTAVNTVNLPGSGKRVLFLTKTSIKEQGYYADSMYVVDLVKAGFIVDVAYDAYVTMDYTKTQQLLNYNCVIIGRGTTSADFSGADDIWWRKTTVPVILMSNNHVGTGKMDWLPGTTAAKTDNAARLSGPIQGKVSDPSDNAFIGVVVPANDSIIDFAYNNIGLVTLDSADRSLVKAKVLVSMVNGPTGYDISTSTGDTLATIDLSDYNETILMARWAPLDTMYKGSTAVNFGWRSFITSGDDHDYNISPAGRKYAYYVLSPEMNQVLINEILALDALEPANVSDDNTLSALTASVGTFDPAFAPGVTKYTLTVPTGTTSVTFTATANNSEAVVTGAGAFATIPGTDSIAVKSQAGSTGYYVIVVKFATIISGNIVPPGEGFIDDYVANAADGDTLYLINDSIYIPINSLVIDKHLVIRAVKYPDLPTLDSMPIIRNDYATDVFLMGDGGNLELIGVDVDGNEGSATKIISLRTIKGNMEIYINRCRLHDVTGDIIGGSKTDTTYVNNFYIRNSFLYNSLAHGAYIKDVWVKDGVTDSKYKWEDITFWNLGQQLEWFQNYSTAATQTYTMDHMTGWNLGTNVTSVKELVGNSDAIGHYNITLSNSIFSEQDAANDQPSLMFSTKNPEGQTNVITLRNIVLYNVNDPAPRDGSNPITITNQLSDDPQFADPDNEDFTIGNTAYETAGDDGSIVGARYWKEGFVDDFADVKSGTIGTKVINSDIAGVFPNPFNSEITFKFNMEQAGITTITLYDLSGRAVMVVNNDLNAGSEVVINTSELATGTYLYKVQTLNGVTSGNIVKK